MKRVLVKRGLRAVADLVVDAAAGLAADVKAVADAVDAAAVVVGIAADVAIAAATGKPEFKNDERSVHGDRPLLFGPNYFASYTVFPPTTVRSTLVLRISSGATLVRSRSSTTKSASIPVCSSPLSRSSNSA